MRLPPLAPTARLRWDRVNPLIERLSPPTVLEIGCGLGGFGARLAGRYEYVGVESDDISCAAARQVVQPAGGTVIQGTAGEVPGGPFDLVCAFEVLEHIEHDAEAVQDWVDRIRPGGHLLVSVPAGMDRFGPSDVFVGHFRRYEPHQLEKLLLAAGLSDVEVTRYGWPLGYVTEALRNLILRHRGPSLSRPSMQLRTARSGRWLQPGPILGALVKMATVPFCWLQRLRPGRGIGLIATGRKSPE